MHLLVGAAPLLADLLQLLLVRAQVAGVTAHGRLEATPCHVPLDLESPARDLEGIPGRGPAGFTLGNLVEPGLGRGQPVVEELELLAGHVRGTGAGPGLPRPADVADGRHESRQRGLGLGRHNIGDPPFRAGHVTDGPQEARTVLALGPRVEHVPYGRPVPGLGCLTDSPSVRIAGVLVDARDGPARPSSQRVPQVPDQRHIPTPCCIARVVDDLPHPWV